MAASSAAVTVAANALAGVITHWGLVNAGGTELSGGSYARVASAGTNSSGTVRPSGDLTFNIPAGTTVGGWRAYSASTSGTDYGGANLTNEAYVGAGQYVLTAASTGFPVSAS